MNKLSKRPGTPLTQTRTTAYCFCPSLNFHADLTERNMKSIWARFSFDSFPYQPPSVSLTSDTLVHGRVPVMLKLIKNYQSYQSYRRFYHFKPGVGQNIAFYALHTNKNFALQISAFRFIFTHFKLKVLCVLNSRLLLVI